MTEILEMQRNSGPVKSAVFPDYFNPQFPQACHYNLTRGNQHHQKELNNEISYNTNRMYCTYIVFSI